MDNQSKIPEPPVGINFLSGAATVLLDMLWGMFEVGATASIAGLPALLPLIFSLFAITTLATTLVQRFIDHDEWGEALAKGMVLGIAAGVPYPVVGTVVGVGLPAWQYLKKLEERQLPPG